MQLDRDSFTHVFLKPGEMYFGEQPAIVTTVLGSCVSVTMFAPHLRIGAICHGLLPDCKVDGCQTQVGGRRCVEGTRFVACSMVRMLEEFLKRKVRSDALEVKMFGGAEMFGAANGGQRSVGRQNLERAGLIIQDEGLRLISSDVGGDQGRKLLFNTQTGEVLLRRLRPTGGCR